MEAEVPGQVAAELFRCRRASECPRNHNHGDPREEHALCSLGEVCTCKPECCCQRQG